MQLSNRKLMPYRQVFLNIKDEFPSLDRTPVILILAGCGVDPCTIHLLKRFWNEQYYVPRESGFYDQPFRDSRSTTQGDVLLSTLFKITMNAVHPV